MTEVLIWAAAIYLGICILEKVLGFFIGIIYAATENDEGYKS